MCLTRFYTHVFSQNVPSAWSPTHHFQLERLQSPKTLPQTRLPHEASSSGYLPSSTQMLPALTLTLHIL